jgi:uncharacterized membrane-anchored protein YitT (DUF2179 family)
MEKKEEKRMGLSVGRVLFMVSVTVVLLTLTFTTKVDYYIVDEPVNLSQEIPTDEISEKGAPTETLSEEASPETREHDQLLFVFAFLIVLSLMVLIQKKEDDPQDDFDWKHEHHENDKVQ